LDERTRPAFGSLASRIPWIERICHRTGAQSIEIQPYVEAFSTTFSALSDRLLEGLNWDNVFVAGGIILASLLCIDSPTAVHKPEDYVSSDIDIYIYGLSPLEANEKVKHIFEIYKRNLPSQAPTLVVRNSKAINFISHFPLKRNRAEASEESEGGAAELRPRYLCDGMEWEGSVYAASCSQGCRKYVLMPIAVKPMPNFLELSGI
jgi:hypothetical protein